MKITYLRVSVLFPRLYTLNTRFTDSGLIAAA
jgi:hypothetical protein